MAKEDRIGALWFPKSDNPRAPFLRGTLEVTDKIMAKEIASALVNGEKVEIVLWKNSYKQDGDKKPDYQIERSKPRDGDYNKKSTWGGGQAQQQGKPSDDGFPDDIPF